MQNESVTHRGRDSGTANTAKTIAYTYIDAGQLVSVVYSSGQTVTYTYAQQYRIMDYWGQTPANRKKFVITKTGEPACAIRIDQVGA
jgi:YD repeat-containing protein